jgi:rhodanese-related sulfurtransferase
MSTLARRKRQARKRDVNVWWWGLLGLAALAGLAAILLWQSGGAARGAHPLEVSVSEAAARREAGAFMLDVREPEEWNEFHIPGATLIPLGELAARVDELPRDQEIVVVCRSGNRSRTGRDILRDAGFEQVSSMAGGVTEWQAAGYPTEAGQ